jgi:hypothetical protein
VWTARQPRKGLRGEPPRRRSASFEAMQRAVALALGWLALAAAPAHAAGPEAEDAVVVIRGSSVSVARPLTPERARDGSAEVEIVRVEAAPPPPAPAPRTREPEREVVVVLVPTPEPAAPVGVPIAWAPAWSWGWDPGHHPWPPRPGHARRRHPDHFPPGFHPLGVHRGPVRRTLHGR